MAWIGVDLDGTLAEYHGWRGMEHIGEPIAPMVSRVRAWLAHGMQVRIVTARASDPAFDIAVVHQWLKSHSLPPLLVTATKDLEMIELWDDRCVQVETNTGRRMDGQKG